MRVVYYISAHGYGHGVRSCEVVNAIRRRGQSQSRSRSLSENQSGNLGGNPSPNLSRNLGGSLSGDPGDVDVRVVSGLPASFLEARLGSDTDLRHESFDVGMAQLDSVRIDPDASLLAVERLLASWDARVESEARALEAAQADVVVCDIPGIPIEAARARGIPAVAVGNFGWDWIYEPYAQADSRWRPAVNRFAGAYAQCDLLLRLPFAEPMTAFPKREDMPLSGQPGSDRRLEIASMTGADPTMRWVLLSFTSLEWDDAALDRAGAVPRTEYFTVLPLAWGQPHFHAVDPQSVPFRDVLASCDLVVSKPGYGIVSECIVNQTPLVHAVRTGFPEYPILVDAIERYLRHALLSETDLYEGRLGPALDRVEAAPEPRERPHLGGADAVADRILGIARAGSRNR
ncbi:MAG: hypothetical protein H6682_09500 [Candidatus Eisenbacteria bacterium]|nr:hypothetical protein [Candidatus Eisenbacteria bacterium]